MKMRNWLGLGRKKVDMYDLDATTQWIQQHFGYLTLAYWGMGVQQTTDVPNPFPITLDNGQLTGSVGNGVAFDPNGQLVRIHPASTTPRAFSITQASVTYDRWDLLVLRYKQGSDTIIKKPSNPLETVALNLHDDFEILVRTGAPAGSPVYPAKSEGDIILAGLRVPANASTGLSVTVDLGVRERAQPAAALRAEIKNEQLEGTVDGANTTFVLSETPLDPQSVAVFLDSLKLDQADYTVDQRTVTLIEAPQPSQVVSAFYVANSASTANPLATISEQAVGIADGANRVFTLQGVPADKSSTLVFVNGVKADADEWALIQGVNSAAIQFVTASAPAPASSVSVLYFVNPATVGRAPTQSSNPGNSGGGSSPEVDYPTLTASDISNGYVSLRALPADPTKVLLDVIGSGPQVYGVDYTVSQQELIFAGEFADDDGPYPLAAGDRLRIVYWT